MLRNFRHWTFRLGAGRAAVPFYTNKKNAQKRYEKHFCCTRVNVLSKQVFSIGSLMRAVSETPINFPAVLRCVEGACVSYSILNNSAPYSCTLTNKLRPQYTSSFDIAEFMVPSSVMYWSGVFATLKHGRTSGRETGSDHR